MSSFTEATFEPVHLADGRLKTRAGRPVYRIKGAAGNGFDFEIGFLGSGIRIHVPEDFETDGPSVPLPVKKILPVARMMKASALHDRLREDTRFTKLEGDCAYLIAMEAEDTPEWAREAAFSAVRLNRSRSKHNPPQMLEPSP